MGKNNYQTRNKFPEPGRQAGTTCAALPTSIPTFQKYSAVMNYGQGFKVGCQEAEHGDNQKIATLFVVLKV